MAHAAFTDAVELLDWLEVESNSSFAMKDKTQILKLELRFLSTFLKYTVNRCTEYEDLQYLFTRIGEVGQNINKLASSSRQREVDGAIRDLLEKIRLIRPHISGVQIKVSSSSMSDELVVNPNTREVQMEVHGASGSGSFLRYELVIEFIATLQEDLEELLACEVNLLQLSLKERIKILKRKLKFLKGMFGFTAKRCSEHDKLNQLFIHVQAVADNAAYLAYSCLNGMDEDMARILALEISNLVQKIDPVKPEVREIYIGVVKGSKSSESKSNTYETDETAVDFVDSLLENTTELLYRDIMPVKDQIEILHLELRSLKYFLKDADRTSLGNSNYLLAYADRTRLGNSNYLLAYADRTRLGNSNYLLAYAEAMAIDSGSLIYSLFEGEVDQDIAEEMSLALSLLLDKFKLGKGLVRKMMYVNVEKANISNFPRTDELGALDLLLQNLKELLNDRVDSIALLKDHIQIVQRDMEFLRSFMAKIEKHEKREDLWRRIIHVMYEIEYVIDSVMIEYVIDSVMVKDRPILHHMLWLSDLIEEIKLIKKEINELLISDQNIHGLQEDDVAKISSGLAFSQFNAPRIDEEMVGFEDQEKEVVQQLVEGSKKKQIVSIVGMPGLGKTFLAQKVYNNPLIKDYFYIPAWCSVSQVYESKELLINILSQMMKTTQEMSECTDQQLAEMLYKCLKGRRYLIVLDDMWDIEAWDALQRSFPEDNNGSRILFTSRFSNLASQTGLHSKLHLLRPFSDEESWELLQKKIFQRESCPSELLEVGREIAKRCNGLPLAVVVVAGLLARIGNEQERWRKVADSLSSFIIADKQRWWMNILDLSYKYLPDFLKPCFLYFGGLSENKQILVAKLTWLWIAEGFVRGNQSHLENIAESYLMDLIDRSLIIASERRSTGGVKACLIHELIRNFCVAKAKEENFLKLIEGCGDLLTSLTSSKAIIPFFPSSYSSSYEQRRLFVHHRQNKKFWSKSSGPCVRSLLFFAPGRKRFRPDEVSSIFRGFKLLKVLDMMHIDVGATFPEGLVLLALLRYLAVSGNFSSLPPSITNIRKLESFLVRAVHLLSLPYDFLNLSKLRHLHINGSMSLGELSSEDPPSQLDCLQTLSKPILSYGDSMNKMRRFPNLKKLSCVFEESWDSSTERNRLPILDFLNQLESLKVSYRGQMRHPCEFSLPSNIKKLTMSGFRLPWEQISIVGQLPHLVVLKLLDEAFQGEEWILQDGEFLKLKFLKLEDMNFRLWNIVSGDCFPCLERLTLDGCRQLGDIPSCLGDIPTLDMILVEECRESLVNAVRRIQEEQLEFGNEWLKIEIKHRSD